MATSQIGEVIQHLRRLELLRERAGLTDGQLLEGYIRRRDEAAVVALVRRHGPMVWGVCRRVLRNHHDAEDAFQATFLVLVRKAASIVPREMLANWLYGVAHRTTLKARATAARRKGRERQVAEMPEPAVTKQELWRDLQPLLDEELRHLPDKYRVAIVLCDLEGKTRKEAARQLGCPEGTVAGRLARARAMLAKRLSRHGLAVSGGALAAMVSQSAASACVPLSAVSSTIKVASLWAAGQAAPAGVISAKVAALTEGVLKAMLVTKLKMAMAVVLGLGLGMMGLTYGMQAGGQAEGQSRDRERERVVKEKESVNPAPVQGKEDPSKDVKDDKTRGIEGVVKEVDEKSILLVGGEKVLLNEKTEFFRETELDVALARLTEVTKGKLIYIQTKKQGETPVAIVVVLKLLQPPKPKAVEEPKKDAKDDKTRVIYGVVKEVDEKSILLMGRERVLLNEKTEFLRETGSDAAPAKLTDVTKGKRIYVGTKKQGDTLVAIVVVLELLQPPEPPAKVEMAKAELVLPRFASDRVEFEYHPGLEDALKGVPSVKAEAGLFGWGGFTIRMTFDPAKADVGDVARAVAAVPVKEEQKQKPAAILLVFTAPGEELTKDQFERVWKALEGVGGIDLKASRKLGSSRVFRIVLDDKGGAKLKDITAALKSAGLELEAR